MTVCLLILLTACVQVFSIHVAVADENRTQAASADQTEPTESGKPVVQAADSPNPQTSDVPKADVKVITDNVGPLRISGSTMGSYYSVVVDSPGARTESEIRKLIDKKLALINRQMSNWDSESEISRFNASDSVDWFPVSKEFAQVTAAAIEIHQKTEGAFDPTLAPVIELWGFGRKRTRKVPSDEQIRSALKHVGMQALEVRSDPPAIRKMNPTIQLNLSALAPGFAVDRIVEQLKTVGVRSFLVDISGEVRFGDLKHSGELWKLGVESPTGGIYKLLTLKEISVATSGNYRNFFRAGGKRYSHLLDPGTGRPVENPPASATVRHESCMMADAWATSMIVLGPERGMQIAQKYQLDVMILMLDENQTIQEFSTDYFRSVPRHEPPEKTRPSPGTTLNREPH